MLCGAASLAFGYGRAQLIDSSFIGRIWHGCSELAMRHSLLVACFMRQLLGLSCDQAWKARVKLPTLV